MNTSPNKYDALEKLIFEENLRIKTLDFRPEIDRILIFLNNNQIFTLPLSSYKNLKKANLKSLKKFELIADGKGVHWPSLDEDLSLKGFLKEILRIWIKGDKHLVIG